MSPMIALAKRKYEKNYVKKITTDNGAVRVYDEAHVAARWKKKVEHINALKKSLPKLQKRYKQDLKSDDAKTRAIAAVVAVIDLTAMRVGNDDSVDTFGTFGATTLKKKHVHVSGSKITFKFLGKKKVNQSFSLTDASVAKIMKELLAGKSGNDFVFEYETGKRVRAKVVNRYLAEFDITAKDLRGFHANRLMREELKHTKDFEKALDNVAEEVGHEPKTLMNQYLDPAIVRKYKKASADLSIMDYTNRELAKILGLSAASKPTAEHHEHSAPVAKQTNKEEVAKQKSDVVLRKPELNNGNSNQLAGKQRVTSPFGTRKDPFTGAHKHHGGLDLHAPIGSKVFAFADGTVVNAGPTGGPSGVMIKLEHGDKNEIQTMYLHLSKVMVSPGQHVSKGQLIGESGNTGRSTSPHLHFVLKYESNAIDPAPYLRDRVIVGS